MKNQFAPGLTIAGLEVYNPKLRPQSTDGGNVQFRDSPSKDHHLSRLAHWFIVASSLLFFFYAINTPNQTWDMLGYSASAISIENADASYVHSYIYQEFKEYATDEEFKKLTVGGAGDYGEVMFLDAEAFNQQISYYKIRIIYVSLILVLVKLGINIYLAGHILSAMLTCTGLLFFYYAYKKVIHPILWMVVPYFFQLFGILDVAQIVSADSLAFFWVGSICFAYMHAHWRTLFLLLITSVLIRTDMIILVALFTAYFLLLRPDFRKFAVVSALLTIGSYFTINKAAGNHGWSTVFYFVFVSDMTATHPAEFSSIAISMEQYMSAVIVNLKGFFYDPSILLFELTVFLQFIVFCLSRKKNTSIWKTLCDIVKNPIHALTLLSCSYVALHYILFPAVWSRFFVGQYMIAGLGLLFILTTLLESHQLKTEQGG